MSCGTSARARAEPSRHPTTRFSSMVRSSMLIFTSTSAADLRAVHRRTPTGQDAAGQQAGLVERYVGIDLDAAVLVDHRAFRERSEEAHEGQVLVAGVMPGGPVGELPALGQVHPPVAE